MAGTPGVTLDFELLILTIERDVEKLAFGMPLVRRYLAPRRAVFVASKACIARLDASPCGATALPFRRSCIAGDLGHGAIGKNRSVIGIDV